MTEFLLGMLASYGLAFGLMNDKLPALAKAIRKEGGFLDRMFQCAYCTGFHTGWFTWLLVFGLPSLSQVLSVVLWAFASAAFCYSLDTWVKRLEEPPAHP